MNEVERILQQRGRERRALGESQMHREPRPGEAIPGCPHTASRAEPDDALGDALREAGAERGITFGEVRYVSTASRAEPDDALETNPPAGECGTCGGREYVHVAWRTGERDRARCPDCAAPITERDLAYALEEALLRDGDRRRALAVLILWKNQQNV